MGDKRESLFTIGAIFESGWSKVDDKDEPTPALLTQKEHQLVVLFEKRKGKPITLVGKFFFDANLLKALHKKVKRQLACGGTIEEPYLLFQGDHRETIRSLFIKEKWHFK